MALYVFFSCSTVKKEITYKRNELKNQAADSARNANQFLDKYDYQQAVFFLNEALKYNTMADNISGMIINYADIGKVYLLWNKLDLGFANYNKALEIALEEDRQNNVKVELAYVYNGIGEADFLLEKYADAEIFFNKALDVEKLLGNEENQASIKVNLAKIYNINKNTQKSLEYFLEALSILEKLYENKKLENIKNLPSTYYSIAKKYYDLGNYGKAVEYAKKAYQIDREIENSSGIAYDYFIFGKIYEKSDVNEALKYYLKAKDLYYLLGDKSQYVSTQNSMAKIYYSQNEFQDYYAARYEAFKNSQNKERLDAAIELLLFLDSDEAKTFFSERERNQEKGKYQDFMK
jgi:tetratricopeptide (TPR) repeat protein